MEASDDQPAVSIAELQEGLAQLGPAQGGSLWRLVARQTRIGPSDHLPPPPTHLVAALVGDDSEEPREERAAGAQVAELSPRPQAGFLDRILGETGVLQQRAGEPVGPVDVRREDALEGSRVTRFGPSDELQLCCAFHA